MLLSLMVVVVGPRFLNPIRAACRRLSIKQRSCARESELSGGPMRGQPPDLSQSTNSIDRSSSFLVVEPRAPWASLPSHLHSKRLSPRTDSAPLHPNPRARGHCGGGGVRLANIPCCNPGRGQRSSSPTCAGTPLVSCCISWADASLSWAGQQGLCFNRQFTTVNTCHPGSGCARLSPTNITVAVSHVVSFTPRIDWAGTFNNTSSPHHQALQSTLTSTPIPPTSGRSHHH